MGGHPRETHLVLFSSHDAVLAAVSRTLFGAGARQREAERGVVWHAALARALGLEGTAGSGRWRVRGPGRRVESGPELPATRAGLSGFCDELIGDAPWALCGWSAWHGSIVTALVTRDGTLAARLADAAGRAETKAYVQQRAAGADFDAVFSSLCFSACDREGMEAWQLGERDGIAPLTHLDESEVEAFDASEFDPEDPEERAILRFHEDLRLCLAVPELARDGAQSVRRYEALELHLRLWELAGYDDGPGRLACSGDCAPAAILRAGADPWRGELSVQQGERMREEAGAAWLYHFEYGGGSDEYVGWLHFADPAAAAPVAEALEADDRLIGCF